MLFKLSSPAENCDVDEQKLEGGVTIFIRDIFQSDRRCRVDVLKILYVCLCSVKTGELKSFI